MKKLKNIAFAALAGALLNVGTMYLCQGVLGLPLFMDTMFTVAFTFFGGLPCGIAAAVMSQPVGHLLINSVQSTDLPNYLYTLCSITAALITAFFMRIFPAECSAGRGAEPAGAARSARLPPWEGGRIFDRISVLFILSLVMCAGMSLLGGIISSIIAAFFTPQSALDAGLSMFRRTLIRKGLPLLAVEVLCRIPVNIPDRLIAVFGGYGFALALTGLSTWIRRKKTEGKTEA
ncbi:MAG: hypothetical protein LBU19_11395 [Treponema sp.]|jgi:uncharacterized protein involved in response to NO|nr:hypothetical protein [Treponema sp.]